MRETSRTATGAKIVLTLLLASALYGSTFPLFRHFDIRQPGGSSDALSYVAMSHGDYDVFPARRYRPVVPMLAAAVRAPLAPFVSDPVKLDGLAFYVVNFGFALATALLLYGTLVALGFDGLLALVGALLFVTSRVTGASVGTSMADAFYFFAIGAICYLTATGRVLLLVLSMPFLVLAKEAVIPFLFLPLFRKETRRWSVVASIVVSIAVVFAVRSAIDARFPAARVFTLGGLVERLAAGNVPRSLARLVRPAGIHDLVHGFGFLAVLAPIGWFAARRGGGRRLPGWVLLPVPIAFAFALVSYNLGRMFFAAYLPVIAYCLVVIERLFGEPGGGREGGRTR